MVAQLLDCACLFVLICVVRSFVCVFVCRLFGCALVCLCQCLLVYGFVSLLGLCISCLVCS